MVTGWHQSQRGRARGRLSVLLVGAALILAGCIPVRPLSSPVKRSTPVKRATPVKRPPPVKVAAVPTITINDVSVTEGNSGTKAAVFTVTLSANATKTVTVHYETTNGAANSGVDFVGTSGTATIAVGHKTTTITVSVKGDVLVEPDDDYFVDLSAPTNATIADARGNGTIVNDDPIPALSVADVAVTEGNAGTTNAVFTVTLSAPSSTTVTVDYATQDGTASTPSDYIPASGTLTFSPTVTSRTFTVPVNGDTSVEVTEAFGVTLSNPLHAVLGDATAQGIIQNDDLPTLAVDDVSVTEGNTGTTDAEFTVTLSAPSSTTITVDYETIDGSATSTSDYEPSIDTLIFAPGETSQPVTITVDGDTLTEPDETFFVHLMDAVSATIVDGYGQGTILNDELTAPTATITGPAAANEGNSGTTNFVFTVTLSAASASTVTVDYLTVDLSAVSTSDYTAQSGTLTFTPGQITKLVTVAVSGDTTIESDEQFIVGLANPTHAAIGGSGVALGTITNDDVLPTATITSPAAQNEGNSGSVNFVFTVTLSAVSANTVTVDYTTVDGSASSASDYTAASGTATFSPGQTTKQIVVSVSGDTTVETNETFTVNLSSPTNATVAGTGIGTGTITNDDTVPTLTLAAPAATNEGNSGTSNFVFTVTLSTASANAVTVDYTTVDGSAAAGSDYVAASGTVSFAAGQTTKQIVVAVNGDASVEINETFTVNLSNPANATIAGTGIGTGTITNDDTVPTLTLAAPAAANEGASGTTNFVFTVTLSAVSANTVTVDYTTVDGSASAPSDYTAATGTLTFAPSQISQPITIAVKGDTTVEINETFTVNLSNPVNATIAGTGFATATVNNDDSLPGLTITAPAAANEGNAGTSNAVFTVTLSAASASTVTVDYSTLDVTATAPGDYTAATGTLTFTAGQTSKLITISVNGDTTNETNETFTVTLSNPANATTATASATATITNDDTPPTLTITSPAAANEGASGTTNFVFAVTLSAVSANVVTVDYTTADGSASSASDYTAASGTVTFAAGQTTKQIVVAVSGDTAVEINETFTVNLSNPTNATIAGTGIGTGTITNDDTVPTLTLAAPAAANEGASGMTNFVFTVTLSAASANTVTVDYTTVDGSASAPSDYTAAMGTLTFTAGQISQPITVAVKGDSTVEINETFAVNLSNPTNATIATASASTTITNDDTLPTLTITSPAAVTEGNANTSINAVFTVTLSAISANTVTIDYATADGSAVAPGDYVAQSGTLTFLPGQTNQQIAVVVKGDTLNEITESFTVNLSNPANATISGAGIGTETITNDDAVPSLSIGNVTQAEGTGGGTTAYVFTVTLSAASGLPVTIDFTTVDGTALAASDYTAQTGTLTFTPGQTTKTITVLVGADATTEGSESFTVVLSSPSNATIAGATGTGTISNDD